MTGGAALRADVKKLTDLLDDAHPGLATWHGQYQRALEGVAEWLHPDDLRRLAALPSSPPAQDAE